MRTENYKKLLEASKIEADHDRYAGHVNPVHFLLLDALIQSRDFLDIMTNYNPVFQVRLDRMQRQIEKLTEFYPPCK